MEQRVRAAHKDGFRTSKILKYGSQNINFPLEMGSFLTYNEKGCGSKLSMLTMQPRGGGT